MRRSPYAMPFNSFSRWKTMQTPPVSAFALSSFSTRHRVGIETSARGAFCRRLLLIFSVTAVLAGTIFGQSVNNGTSTPIPGAGHNYIELLNETVDPANGSLSLNFGFDVPPGRGVTVPFAFTYHSNGAMFQESFPHRTSSGMGQHRSRKPMRDGKPRCLESLPRRCENRVTLIRTSAARFSPGIFFTTQVVAATPFASQTIWRVPQPVTDCLLFQS